MSCNPLIDPACVIVNQVIQPATSTATNGILGGIAQAISGGVRWIVTNTAAWWIQIPSPDLASEPAITRIQAWLLPVTAAVATACVIGAGLRMILTRRANPLLDVASGLFALAAATTIGVLVPALLLKAGDAWSTWVLRVSTGGQFAARLSAVLTLGGSGAPAVVVVLGFVAIVLALVQAVLMLFRQVALVILAGVLPLAAAGVTSPATRPWLRKVTSWMLALIFYKPAAAAVYAAAFTMIGSGRSARTVLMGFVTLLLSVVMLPALMKFFTWTTGAIAGNDGGGGQLLGVAAMGAMAIGAMRSGPGGGAASAAQDQAAYLSARLGPGPGDAPAGAASLTTGTTGTTAATGAATAPAGTATTATATGAAGATAATTAAAGAAAGPVGLAAAATAQAAQAAASAAETAITPEDQP